MKTLLLALTLGFAFTNTSFAFESKVNCAGINGEKVKADTSVIETAPEITPASTVVKEVVVTKPNG